ncbi:MAG TPA: PTS fructose transporter subunit IIA [Syntrophus sp. (in: bacteria)]|nr:PTS fructose transporter subunit IIA [Syntrophus sp. (in: bacteria)]
MKITDMLRKEYMIERLLARGKTAVLEEMVAQFHRGPETFSEPEMVRVLLEREKLGSTGIGEGIAIPHGKLEGLEGMIVAFGRSPEGIDFEAMDGKPVHLFFMLMAPENSTGQHLKVLARISRILKDGDFRQQLLDAGSVDQLYRIIADKDDRC